MNADKIAKKLKNERMKKNITQKELANILNIDKATISRYENGHIIPDIKNLKKYSNYFEVTIDYILNNKVTNKKNNFEKFSQFIIKYIYENFDDKKVKHLISNLNIKNNKKNFLLLSLEPNIKNSFYSYLKPNIKKIYSNKYFIFIKLDNYPDEDNTINIKKKNYIINLKKLLYQNIIYTNNKILTKQNKDYLVEIMNKFFENQNEMNLKANIKTEEGNKLPDKKLF